jgi:hypothetical protein
MGDLKAMKDPKYISLAAKQLLLLSFCLAPRSKICSLPKILSSLQDTAGLDYLDALSIQSLVQRVTVRV